MKKNFIIKFILILVLVYSSSTAINYNSVIDILHYENENSFSVTSMGNSLSQSSVDQLERFVVETDSVMYLKLENTLYITNNNESIVKLKMNDMDTKVVTVAEIVTLSNVFSFFNSEISRQDNQFQLQQQFSGDEIGFPSSDITSMEERFNEFLLFQYVAIVACSFTALIYCLINEINRQKIKFAILTSLGHSVLDVYKELYLKETIIEFLIFVGSIVLAIAYFKYNTLLIPLILLSIIFMVINVVITILVIARIKQSTIMKYESNSVHVSYFQVIISILISVVFVNAFSQFVTSSMESYEFSKLLQQELPKYEDTYFLGSNYAGLNYEVINENNKVVADSFTGSFSLYYGSKYSDLIDSPVIAASKNYFIHNQYTLTTCDNLSVDINSISEFQVFAVDSVRISVQDQLMKYEGELEVSCLAENHIFFDLQSGDMAHNPIIRLTPENSSQGLYVSGDIIEIANKIAEVYDISVDEVDISPVSEPLQLRYNLLVNEQFKMVPVLISTIVTLLLLFSNISRGIMHAYIENIRVKHIIGFSFLSKYIYFYITFIIMLIVPVLLVIFSEYSILTAITIVVTYSTLLALVMFVHIIGIEKRLKERIKDGN